MDTSHPTKAPVAPLDYGEKSSEEEPHFNPTMRSSLCQPTAAKFVLELTCIFSLSLRPQATKHSKSTADEHSRHKTVTDRMKEFEEFLHSKLGVEKERDDALQQKSLVEIENLQRGIRQCACTEN